MAPREDLISSAVSFLQDPSVATSPLEKRLEFLKSKNLTQEEIDLSLARASGQATAPAAPQSATYYPTLGYQNPPPGYPPYGGYGQWPAGPPQPPRRDWRDYFILATTVTAASYGLYWLTDRYIRPLIAPPTPPQLEQDKAYIDEQFNRAFTLIETLASDTDTLKKAEEERTKKLDSAIEGVENVVNQLKEATQKREDEARRMESEIRSMKDSLPRAIDGVRDGSERQLKELSQELASLKLLMSNRMSGVTNGIMSPSTVSRPSYQGIDATKRASAASSDFAAGGKTNAASVSGPTPTVSIAPLSSTPSHLPTGISAVPGENSNTKPIYGGSTNKPASIPAWQMAAQNKAAIASSTNATSSTAAQNDGQEVVNMLNS